ncbi:MAG TPA: hypothetical protein VJJ02_00765 [Candidatus Paceibacterota bacterium]
MPNEEKPKLTLVSASGESEQPEMVRALEYEELVYNEVCEVEQKPRWCIWGNDGKGGKKVLFWIRPSEKDEWTARRIAKYLKDHGDDTSVQMTEWNPELKGPPIYAEKSHIESVG